MTSRWIRLRLVLVAALLGASFGLIVHRAYRLQAVEGPRLREMAEQQYLKEIELPPRRGTITDRHGIPLAVSVDVDSVYANPRQVGERAADTAAQLAEVLGGIDRWALQKQLSGRRYFVWVKRRVTATEARRVRELKLRGVALTKESHRFYPNHGLGSSVVGFAGADAKGLEGAELGFDGWLRGIPRRIAGLRDALGRAVFADGAQPTDTATHDVQLALDKFIQFESERAVAEAQSEVRPESGWVGVVVLDPQNGDVLAMANAPSFDPNRYREARPSEWRNRAIADAFEPGSTMKIFSIGAALELGVVHPGDLFNCERGHLRVGHYTIHDTHPHDQLTVADIIKKSSNIGAAKVAFMLGKQRLHHYYDHFGFGHRTTAVLRGERAGVLPPAARWSDVALANLAFGQGLTVTVLQLAQGFAAIANRGVMMRPRLALAVRNERGEQVKEYAPEGRRVLSPGTADKLLQLMRAVVEPGGTGKGAALERYTVAGKTGTAQKVDQVTRHYATDRWVSSFIGLVPASRPRLVVAVVMNEPRGDKHLGGDVAAPIFRRIAERAVAYLGVKPDQAAPDPSRRRASPPAVVAVEGEGFIDEENAPPLPGEGGPSGEVLIPDFTGMSMVEVLAAARRTDLRVEFEGSGRAVGQSPGPGPAARQTTCRVSFRPPG